ncbi:MAG: hypothetical protein EPO13_07445 [Actinomycetota bacterium]|nr:MAG: hypothetical protein EPO13_07445 [Actinomycetota bacterium]
MLVTAGDDAGPAYAVLDIDGVLADVSHRVHHVAGRPKDWAAFFAAAPDDPLLPEGAELAGLLAAAGRTVVYLTGRPENCRTDTEAWLARHGLPPGPVHMRRSDDRRPARVTKVERLRSLARHGRVTVVVDDDSAVIRAVRAAGFTAVHATWLDGGTDGVDGSPVQPALFEAQELDGRT